MLGVWVDVIEEAEEIASTHREDIAVRVRNHAGIVIPGR